MFSSVTHFLFGGHIAETSGPMPMWVLPIIPAVRLAKSGSITVYIPSDAQVHWTAWVIWY